MFKTLIDEQTKRLEEEKESLKIKIKDIDEKIRLLDEQRESLEKEFNNMPLSKENRAWYLEALNTRIESDKKNLEDEKNAIKTTGLEEQFKVILKNELLDQIMKIENEISRISKEEEDLKKDISDVIIGGNLDDITNLNKKMSNLLSSKDILNKTLRVLKDDIEASFDKYTYEEIVGKLKRIENVDLESKKEEIDEFIVPDSYDDIIALSNDMESKLDELLKSDAETIINSNVMVSETTIDDYFEMVNKYMRDNAYYPICNDINPKLEIITKKYEEYSKLNSLIIEIIKTDIDELKNSDINAFYSKFVSIKLKIDNIDVKYQSVKQSLSKMLEVVKNEFKTPHKLDAQVNPEESLDNDDDKVEIESMIKDLKNNMSNISKQKFVDTARQILSKIESLEDEEIRKDLKKQLKLVEFGSASSESNDNLNLEELKEKFKEKYSSIERAMLTDVVIEFDDIESLAAQFDDILTKSNAYEYIDDLKKLYKLSSTVSIKIKKDYITTDDEKEITNLLHEIRDISPVVYKGMNERFIKRKTELNKSKNSNNENENKIFKALEYKINYTAFDKLDDLKKEVEKVKESKEISEDEAIKLNLLINNVKDQLGKIEATSKNLIENKNLILLKKFVNKDGIQEMLDYLNKYVDSIKTIYEIVKLNPVDSVVAIKYDELVNTFVEFNNKVSTKFNIEKTRDNPKSSVYNCKYNKGNVILRLSKERIEEKGYKKLFANTEKILNAKNTISELQVKIRVDGFNSLKWNKRRKYDKSVNAICEELIEMLNDEIKELEKDNFTLNPKCAFDSWILMLSIMPNSVGDYTRSGIIELVAKYASMIKNVIEKSNDESLKGQLGKDNIDLDAWYSTIAAISLYKKENDFFDFKDESVDDDITLYADHSSVLYGIRYMDPETKVRNLSK